MNCPVCGAPQEDGVKFCTECGAKIDGENGEKTEAPAPAPAPEKKGASVPKQYRPIKPWGYFGLELLFAIPGLGLICLLIFTFSKRNLNRRNFARSYWCALLVFLIVAILAAIIGFATGYAQKIIADVQTMINSIQ